MVMVGVCICFGLRGLMRDFQTEDLLVSPPRGSRRATGLQRYRLISLVHLIKTSQIDNGLLTLLKYSPCPAFLLQFSTLTPHFIFFRDRTYAPYPEYTVRRTQEAIRGDACISKSSQRQQAL